MVLRKESSQFNRSSELPLDFSRLVVESLTEALKEKFGSKVDTYELVVEGRIFPEELFLRLGLLEKGGTAETSDRLRQMSFEASLDFDKERDSAHVLDLLHGLVEGATEMLVEYLEQETDGDIEFPVYWTTYGEARVMGRPLYLQTTRVNSKLESEADRFLAQHGFLEDGSDDPSIDPFDRARLEAMEKLENEKGDKTLH